jgi:pilus assembly protein Flp/PilA
METARNAIRRFLRQEKGATAVEYSLLIGLIAIVIFGAVASLGTATSASYQSAAAIFGS